MLLLLQQLYKISTLSITMIVWSMLLTIVSTSEGKVKELIVNDLEKMVETIPIDNFEGDPSPQLTQMFDRVHGKTVYTLPPSHLFSNEVDGQVIYERESNDTDKSTIIFSPEGKDDKKEQKGTIKIKNLSIYVGLRRNPFVPSSYKVFYVYLRNALTQDDMSSLSVLGNRSFIVEFDSWKEDTIRNQSQSFVGNDNHDFDYYHPCSYSSVLVPCTKFQNQDNLGQYMSRKRRRRVIRSVTDADTNINEDSPSARSLFRNRMGYSQPHRKSFVANLLSNLLSNRPHKPMVPTKETEKHSTTAPLPEMKLEAHEHGHHHDYQHHHHKPLINLGPILNSLTGLLIGNLHRPKLEDIRMWKTTKKHNFQTSSSTTTEPIGETSSKKTTAEGGSVEEDSTVNSTAFKIMQAEEDENIDAERQLEANRPDVKGGALVKFETLDDYPDDDPTTQSPVKFHDGIKKASGSSAVTAKANTGQTRQKRSVGFQRSGLLTMRGRKTKMAPSPEEPFSRLNLFGLELGAMWFYRRVTLKNFTDAKTPQKILHLYLTTLRMDCMKYEVDYFQKMFNSNCLAVMRNDKTLKIPQSCHFLKKKKLKEKGVRQLLGAFELTVFSKVFHEQLANCSNQCNSIPKKAPDVANISHNIHLLGKLVFHLPPMMNKNRKLFQHFVKLHQNMVKTLQVAHEKLKLKLSTDSATMMQTQDGREKEVNLNDRMYLKGLILFLLHGGAGPTYLNGEVDTEDEFKKFYLKEKADIEYGS